jgi:hypothetical protein
MEKISDKNTIYKDDFNSLKTELLKIDYLRFNLDLSLSQKQINQLAVYFKRIGFSSYTKDRDSDTKRVPIFTDKRFEVTFIVRTPYQEGTHLEFAGESAQKLYDCIKKDKFNWKQLEQYRAFLGRIDSCYDRLEQFNDQIL